ncbi:DUF6065 family protein [Actinoplanes sp. CA-142083]|uniref:DUF6065 family protein n=1 Tax=Actinoplanes sp. CA-142083 TaxID=3239903 RepID=UPI003D8DD340
MELRVHRLPWLAGEFLPRPAPPRREWWEEQHATRRHARHCLPLTMANSLGFTVHSPFSFRVSWDGDVHGHAVVESDDPMARVSARAAPASFTLHPGFVVATDHPGEFVRVGGVPNRIAPAWVAMEALIEAWWNPAEFSIVCLLTRPGTVTVAAGDAVAQMNVFLAEAGGARLRVDDSPHAEWEAWQQRRGRPEYVKDLDYLRGRHPDGRPVETHYPSWRSVS